MLFHSNINYELSFFTFQTSNEKPVGTVKKYEPSLTAKARADEIIRNKMISLVPENQCWSVKTLSGITHSVSLFDEDGKSKHYCTCSATVTFCHLMAAMKSISYKQKSSSRQPNGTRMRQNLLKKADKRSGTKKGRVLDKDNERRKELKQVKPKLKVLRTLYT